MRIIGIDPGYDRMGVAVVERTKSGEVLVFSTCLTTQKKDPLPTRLFEVGKGLERIIKTYSPNALALETLFFNKNQKTALMVAEVRGVILYLATLHRLPIFEYSPQAVKIATTGHGASDKKQVASMITRLLPGFKKDVLDDEYDAAAVALCCLAHERYPQLS